MVAGVKFVVSAPSSGQIEDRADEIYDHFSIQHLNRFFEARTLAHACVHARHGMAQHPHRTYGMARHGTARRGAARRGALTRTQVHNGRQGVAVLGFEIFGAALHCTAPLTCSPA